MIEKPLLNKDTIKIKRALLSVFDKTGIVELAQKLVEKIEILSTGGTAKILKQIIFSFGCGDYTNFPEIMDGR